MREKEKDYLLINPSQPTEKLRGDNSVKEGSRKKLAAPPTIPDIFGKEIQTLIYDSKSVVFSARGNVLTGPQNGGPRII